MSDCTPCDAAMTDGAKQEQHRLFLIENAKAGARRWSAGKKYTGIIHIVKSLNGNYSFRIPADLKDREPVDTIYVSG